MLSGREAPGMGTTRQFHLVHGRHGVRLREQTLEVRNEEGADADRLDRAIVAGDARRAEGCADRCRTGVVITSR
jgi:hypothetical protein